MSQYFLTNVGVDAILMVDATLGNETVSLPRGYASGRKLTVRRKDSTGNSVTVAPPSGQSLNGVVDATLTVGADSEVVFVALETGAWESLGLTPARLATDPALTGTYAQLADTRAAARNLLPRLQPNATAFALSADIPTVTIGTSATITGRVVGPQTGEITEVGSRGVWDPSFSRLTVSNGLPGLDFFHTGSAVEVQFFTGASGVIPIWVFVDGQPITATQDVTTLAAASNGTLYYLKLAFGAAKTRRIEVFVSHFGAGRDVRGALGDTFAPAPRKPAVAFVGDSFWAGSGGSTGFDVASFLASRRLGVECFQHNITYGGTGYVTAGSFTVFGSAGRVSGAAAASPDLIVFQGSVNDDGTAGVQAAATAAYAAYRAACPTTPLVVLGTQPSNATSTLSANRQANIAAIKAAAAAAGVTGGVIGFHDEIGTAASSPAAWSSATTYNSGDLVTFRGSVWQAVTGAGTQSNNQPSTTARWKLVTWGYYGTGQVGTTASDGPRDTLVYSDGVHPTSAAQWQVYMPFLERAIRNSLTNFVANGTQLVA